MLFWSLAPKASSLIIRSNTADNWKVSDSMERQQLYLDSLKTLRTKLVSSKHNSIPAQIIIVRRTGESTGVQDQHHWVFINQHTPLSMLTKVEVLSIWYLIALQRHVLITYINFAGVMRENLFISFAWKNFVCGSTYMYTHRYTYTAQTGAAFFLSGQSQQLYNSIEWFL